MSLITAQNLGKSYHSYKSELGRFSKWFSLPFFQGAENWIIRNISFSLNKGESIGIVGKNGAGKSTLLKMLTGVLHPTEGVLKVHGKIAAIIELGMGFDPNQTARENAFYALGLMGYKHTEISQVMSDIEKFADIGSYFNQPMRIYSSGMYVRVAFAVVTAFKPDILIVDEALSVGDASFQAKCYDRISHYRDQGMCLLLVSHSMSDIINHCDRAIFIKDGHLECEGDAKKITNLYMANLQLPQKVSPNAIDDTKNIMDQTGIADLFHTRPGYREEEHRWGEGGASIIDYSVSTPSTMYPAVIPSNELADFTFTVRFDNNYENITAGFLIKTIEGVFLYGTNSYQLLGQTYVAKKGQLLQFKFKMPVCLNTGHYLISFGIGYGSQENLTPLDRRYDSVILTIHHPHSMWGILDLKATFEVKEVTI